ncbi:MAG: hypothetical protein LBM25_01120 [Bacteroidales bacterium]|nr:hypothetical protein [Bacteroidales bacterium]
MKKIFLLLILIGCYFTSSFAQKEKFFSLEGNLAWKGNVAGRDLDYSLNYAITLSPAFTINRFKLSIGLSYFYAKYYKSSSIKRIWSFTSYYDRQNRYSIYNINIPINLHFNFYKNNKIWLSCFSGLNINNFIYGTSKDENMNIDYKLKRGKQTDAVLSIPIGFEFSIIASNNLKVNISPFIDIPFYKSIVVEREQLNNTMHQTNKTVNVQQSFPLCLSVGVEYMFR